MNVKGATPFRPPSSYVHGTCGPVAVVPGRVASWLLRHADLARLRVEHRGMDGEVDSVLVAITVAAHSWRTSVVGSDVRKEPEGEPQSGLWLTSAQAADLLGLTDRAVRLAIYEERLQAERVGGRWVIHREDLEHFRAARRAG